MTVSEPAKQRRQHRLERGQNRDDPRRQDRAGVNADRIVRPYAAVAEHDVVAAPLQAERPPPPASEWDGARRLDRHVEPARLQGGDDEFPLPGQIACCLEVLQGAAAA
jgi:hypothetical protein